ncbi:MAG: glycoside hydrolase family 28 protein [Eubacteriales bacterium]|nr:glycoside hydrolase family 28 protein [Eubacteriales bacterium]
MGKYRWAVPAAALAVSLAGCGGGQAQPSGEAQTEAAAEEQSTQEQSNTDTKDEAREENKGNDILSWDMADEILSHISDPVFPEYSVNIVDDYGAVPDDGKLDTEAIQKAIDETSGKGGGTVIVPAGSFDTGAITLKDNVNLCLQDPETKLLFTQEINHENYPLVYGHWEGQPLYNYSAFIYAKDAENIALTGDGTMDGQAGDGTPWCWMSRDYMTDYQDDDRNALMDMNANRVPVKERIFGEGHYLRPNFIQLIGCRNVLVEGITLLRSPMWEVNPVLCTNVTVRGIHISTKAANNDGIDPESSNYVLIEDNYFDTGDDCIAIKSGRNADGRETNTPSQNIVIRNNVFADGHGGITIGSEVSGGVRNVFADNNQFDSPNLKYALRFKTNAVRGGEIENIYLRNTTIKSVSDAVVHATMLYEEGRHGDFMPRFKNITIENLKSTGGDFGIFVEAFEEVPVTGLVMKNVELDQVGVPLRAVNWEDPVLENVVINGTKYPAPSDTRMDGIPCAENTVTADSILLGGDPESLEYTWSVAGEKDGKWEKKGEGKTWTLPGKLEGAYLKVTARDENGNENASIAYRILPTENVCGVDNSDPDADAVKRLAAKGLLDPERELKLQDTVTRLDMARMLAGMWNLTDPKKSVDIADVTAEDADYGVIAAVIEEGMMELKDGAFNSQEPVSREELADIAIKSCGAPYDETTFWATPTYDDLDDIDTYYHTNVATCDDFGFMKAKEDNLFKPKDNVDFRTAVQVLDKVAIYARR